MVSQYQHDQLTRGAKHGGHAMDSALRLVFGEVPESFASITSAEFFNALRLTSGRDKPSDDAGGQPVKPDAPRPRKPSSGNALQRRMAESQALYLESMQS
jgi:hypothetical protein